MGEVLDAIQEALEAGRSALKEALQAEKRPEKRGAYGDLSYSFDIAAEQAIVNVLKRRFHKAVIASEEMGVVEPREPDYYILVDPVDGSKNAFRGIPFYSSAIIVANGPKLSDVFAAGLIDHPTGELYLGEEGGEVFAADGPPRLSGIKRVREAFIFLDHGSFNHLESRRWAERIAEESIATRFMASATLEAAYILRGRVDGFACLSKSLKLMDFLAPIYLLKLSGGCYEILGAEGDIDLLTMKKYGAVATSTRELLEEIMSLRE